METAFARARRFLDYHPVAKWSSLVAAVATGVFFVLLLLILALFADLMVNRGEIPAYVNLAARPKHRFQESLQLPQEAETRKQRFGEIRERLKAIGVDDPRSVALAVTETPESLSFQDQERRMQLLWFADLPPFMRERVGDDAAEWVRYDLERNLQARGLDAALNQDLQDYGILSLVVGTRGTFQGWFARMLARWGHWTWREGNTYYLQGLFILALVIALLRTACAFLARYLAAYAVIEAMTRLRRAVYHHTHRLGTLAFKALGPSEAVSVSTRHLEAVHDGLYTWLTVVFREPIKFGLLVLFALLVNFWLALLFLLFAFLVWLIGGQVAAYFRRQGRAASHRAAEQLALIQESLMLMRLVKVYLMELFNQARVERQLARYANAQRRRYFGEAIYRPLLASLGLVAALILLLLAGYVVLGGYLGVTSTLVMATALVSLYWPLETWLDHRRYLRRARDSARVVFAFLDRPGGVGQVGDAEFLPAMARQLEFDDVTLLEPGTGRRLLQGVSLTIQAGQRVAFVGPDDMEKHALVYLLPRFLDPTSGEIRIDRKNLRWVTLDSLRTQIGIVMQHNLVFNDTVANNIGCGDPGYNLPQIIEAAKVAHAHQFIQKLPQGYETPIGEMGHSLNISERFRIALARAILRDPALLVIEEPNTPLDEDSKSLLDDTFARVLPGRTVLFLPHRLSTIRHCDRVFLLYNGRVEAAGDHRELLAQNDLYRHLQYLEFNEFANLLTAPAAAMPGERPA
jgi:ATP-binding cassette subfamily B protein